MQRFFPFVVFLLFTTALAAQTPSDLDTTSYSLGILLGNNLKTQGLDEVDMDAFVKGFQEAMAGKPGIDLQQANTNVQEHMKNAKARAGAKVREAGEAFLAENAKRPEVKVTDSGLQYEVLQEGSGASPTATQTVKVHYHGTLLDGTVFDSSVERGETIEFPLNRVIAGWTEGLQLMKEGAKYRFYIPQDLAYGDNAAGQIPPYSTLIFDVELFEVK